MASQTGPSKLTSPPRMAVITVNGDCDSPASQNGSVPLSSWYSSMPSAHCGPGKPSVSVPYPATEPRLPYTLKHKTLASASRTPLLFDTLATH